MLQEICVIYLTVMDIVYNLQIMNEYTYNTLRLSVR